MHWKHATTARGKLAALLLFLTLFAMVASVFALSQPRQAHDLMGDAS
jgi:hypothetical protein